MHRTQIQLTPEQLRAIKRAAAARNVSMAELIREAIDVFLSARATVSSEERRRRALAIAGRFASGRADVSAKHDDHLSEIFRK